MSTDGDATTLVLYYHPFTRAAAVVPMLEEAGCTYALKFLDLTKGEHKQDPLLAKNRMGKLPTLIDQDVVITESAAIALYLADRYGGGKLAPALDDPARGTYFRWACFSPSVLEPAAYAASANWEYNAGSAGWGRLQDVLDTISAGLAEDASGPWLLGERFSMADMILGGTLRFLMMFKMVEARPEYTAYVDALSARPSHVRATAINQQVVEERGLRR